MESRRRRCPNLSKAAISVIIAVFLIFDLRRGGEPTSEPTNPNTASTDSAGTRKHRDNAFGVCSSEELEAARAQLGVWCTLARNAFQPADCSTSASAYRGVPSSGREGCDKYKWHGRPMFQSEWDERVPCSRIVASPATAADFAITLVAMDGSLTAAAAIATTWVNRTRSWGATIEVIRSSSPASNAAAESQVRSVAQLTVLHTETPAAAAESASSSQVILELPLLALQHAVAARPSARWHILVTDETWVSADEAVALVRFFDHRLPLLIGSIDSGVVVGSDQASRAPFATRPAGAAGIIISAAGAAALAEVTLSPSCPWPSPTDEPLAQSWDVVLGRCAWVAGVPQMPSVLMHPSMDNVLGKSWHFDRNDAPMESLITTALGAYTYLRADGTDGESMAAINKAIEGKFADPADFSKLPGWRRRMRRRRRR